MQQFGARFLFLFLAIRKSMFLLFNSLVKLFKKFGRTKTFDIVIFSTKFPNGRGEYFYKIAIFKNSHIVSHSIFNRIVDESSFPSFSCINCFLFIPYHCNVLELYLVFGCACSLTTIGDQNFISPVEFIFTQIQFRKCIETITSIHVHVFAIRISCKNDNSQFKIIEKTTEATLRSFSTRPG